MTSNAPHDSHDSLAPPPDAPGAAEAERISQLLAGMSMVMMVFISGHAALALVLFFLAPIIALVDVGLYAIARMRGGRAKTGLLAWALYVGGLRQPALLACGMAARLVAALPPRFHWPSLLVFVATMGLCMVTIVEIGPSAADGHSMVNAGSMLVAALAALAQWWASWLRRGQERADVAGPMPLAAQAAQREGEGEKGTPLQGDDARRP